MHPAIGLLLIVVGIVVLLNTIVSKDSPKTQSPKRGDFRVVERLGGFYLQKYYDYPTWHDLGGKCDSAAEAQERLRFHTEPFEKIVVADTNAPVAK